MEGYTWASAAVDRHGTDTSHRGRDRATVESTEQLKGTRRRPSNLTAYEIALRARTHAMEGYDKADRALIDQSIRDARRNCRAVES